MKTRKQKRKRSLARKRDRESPSLWRYMGMNHVCPNRLKPSNRHYIIYDDISKRYVSDPNKTGYGIVQTSRTPNKKHAQVFEYNFHADKTIAYLKGKPGAWRAIRVK